jgi:tetratricopeptide (TPR) repeat protein
MQQAVAAAPERSADRAYVLALLGDLQLGRGRLDAAASAYRRSLADGPGNAAAELGLSRVLVAHGDLRSAASSLATLTERLPLPDAVALHGDVLAAWGDADGAARQHDLVRAIEALNASAGGVAVDLELARFEAAQIGCPGGDATRAIDLATRAHAVRPTIFADDTLGWALRRAGRAAEALPLATSAVRTDIGDATIWWHLAAIQADLGRDDAARTSLAKALDLGGPLPLLERPEADALAQRLAVPLP